VLARVLDAPMATVSATWIQDATRAVTREYLEPLASRLRASGRLVSTHAAVHSDAARGILEMAKSVNAFGVAIATHGRTGLSRVALGSVADKVIRASAVPVLVAPSMER
jgi:nucleotide-binding universal stress UspA family protein